MRENTELPCSKTGSSQVFNELLTLTFAWVLVLLVISVNKLDAQREMHEIMRDIRKSTLYFIIPTSAAKLTVLQEEVSQSQNPGRRRRLENLLVTEQSEIDSFASAIRIAVTEHYSFSPYDFVADTIVRSLLQEKREDHKEIYLVRRSKTESGADALILVDSDLRPLGRPIPYYARLTRISSFFDAFFGQSNYSWKDLNEVIRKWSNKLENYYEKVERHLYLPLNE
jgi:hypothetical protein